MISNFYNKTYTTVRKVTGDPQSPDTATTVSNAVAGFETPVSDQSQLYIENNIGNEFEIAVDDLEDIRVDDDMYDNNTGEKRNVLGIRLYEDRIGGENSHQIIRVTK